MGDTSGGAVLLRIALAGGILWIIDLVCLVWLLAIGTLRGPDEPERPIRLRQFASCVFVAMRPAQRSVPTRRFSRCIGYGPILRITGSITQETIMPKIIVLDDLSQDGTQLAEIRRWPWKWTSTPG